MFPNSKFDEFLNGLIKMGLAGNHQAKALFVKIVSYRRARGFSIYVDRLIGLYANKGFVFDELDKIDPPPYPEITELTDQGYVTSSNKNLFEEPDITDPNPEKHEVLYETKYRLNRIMRFTPKCNIITTPPTSIN